VASSTFVKINTTLSNVNITTLVQGWKCAHASFPSLYEYKIKLTNMKFSLK